MVQCYCDVAILRTDQLCLTTYLSYNHTYHDKTIMKIVVKFCCDILAGIDQSTITEKMAAVHFPSNALRSKIFKKANRCLLKYRHGARGRFVYSAKISHH